MEIREMRDALGETQSEFAQRYNIPYRTIQNWETGKRKPPQYILDLLEEKVKSDLINRKTYVIPKYNPKKRDLPNRQDYCGVISWLIAIKKCLGDDFVFALDESLMCQGLFLGRVEEYLIYGYGNDSALKYNGVVLLGNTIDNFDVIEMHGLRFTNFNRTLVDSFVNEDILDMQGITEALSDYYYEHGESFEGITIPPRYIDRFKMLSRDAIEYYDS